MILKKGREFTAPPLLGNYLHKAKDNRVTLLRGKYKGAYLDTVPVGYVGQFLLTQCREDMTTEEIKLCEAYAGDAIMKKIRRKNKMTIKNKVQVEVTAGKGIAEAFDIAAKHGCAEIALTIPVPNSYKKPTVFDKLRTRGTPLELIGSYILAGYGETARTILQSCVLEAIYERLTEKYHAKCFFENETDSINKINSINKDDIHAIILKTNHYGIAFNDKEKKFIEKYPNTAPITSIHFKEQERKITDNLQTTILSIMENILQDVEQTVNKAISNTDIQTDESSEFTFTIVPDNSVFNLRYLCEESTLYVTGNIALYTVMKIKN